jgi:hypothetical protein
MNLTSTQRKQLLGVLTLAHAQAIAALHGSTAKPDRSETIMRAFVIPRAAAQWRWWCERCATDLAAAA